MVFLLSYIGTIGVITPVDAIAPLDATKHSLIT